MGPLSRDRRPSLEARVDRQGSNNLVVWLAVTWNKKVVYIKLGCNARLFWHIIKEDIQRLREIGILESISCCFSTGGTKRQDFHHDCKKEIYEHSLRIFRMNTVATLPCSQELQCCH